LPCCLVLFLSCFVSAFSLQEFTGRITGNLITGNVVYTTFSKTLFNNVSGPIINNSTFTLDKPMNVTKVIVSWGEVVSSCDNGAIYLVNVNGAVTKLTSTTSLPSTIKSYPIVNSYSKKNTYTQVIINSSCDAGLKLAKLVVEGKFNDNVDIIPECTSNLNITCANGTSLISKRCEGGRFVNVVPAPKCEKNCTLECGPNVNTTIGAPFISVAPSSCPLGSSCASYSNISLTNGENSTGYYLVWKFHYYDGSMNEICSCNATESIGGMSTKISSSAERYILPVTINDNSGKVLNSVEVFVSSFNGSNRSEFATILASDNSISNITIDYGCVHECFELGKKRAIGDGETNIYQNCTKFSGSNCYNWSANITCDSGWIYNDSLQACTNKYSFNCNGPGMFCSSKHSNNPNNFRNATFRPDKSCNLAKEKCYVCDANHTYKSEKDRCDKDKCTVNCTLSRGAVCRPLDTDLDSLNEAANSSLECCNYEVCSQCKENYHWHNGSCVLDNCVGEITGSNFTLGANKTTNSAVIMNWTYKEKGALGACQWNCSENFEIDLETNSSCRFIQKVDCEMNLSDAVCSNVSISNAENKSIKGTCNAGETCYVCSGDYKLQAGLCVKKSCADFGLIDNGVECVQNITCSGSVADGCIVKRGNSPEVCVKSGFRLRKVINGVSDEKYCDIVTKKFVSLIADGASCQYSSQCKSNLCANGTCLNVKSQIGTITRSLYTIGCFVNNGLNPNSAGYRACILEEEAKAFPVE
jgi:hypothetical protein